MSVLRKLGPDATARLLWHGYVLAACNLHVILDDFPLPDRLPTVDTFRRLIGDREKRRLWAWRLWRPASG
jgi:hypothetical protein